MTKNDLKVIDELLNNKGFEYLEGLAVYQKDENIISVCDDASMTNDCYYLVVYTTNNNTNEMMFNNLEKFKRFIKS